MKQIVLLLAFLLSVSCHRRPLEDPANNTTLRVAVNIKAIMNITCDIYNEKIPVPTIEPEMMRVLIYDPTSKKIASETYISDITYDDEGTRCLQGDISVRPGTYQMLIYNFDMMNIFNAKDFYCVLLLCIWGHFVIKIVHTH